MASEASDERHVVTVFLRNAGEILLLKRSESVGTSANRWGAVSGDAEGDAEAAARWEIDEETGLGDVVTFVRRGDPLAFTDETLGVQWVVHPFLFDCHERAIRPNDEVAETAWVSPPEIRRRETVPKLWEAYDRVRPSVESVATDAEHGSAWLSIRALEVLRDEAAVVDENGGWGALVAVATDLLDARPSMTALTNRVNRAMSEAGGDVGGVERAAHEGIGRALDADRQASESAAARVAGETVLTLSRSGTIERALSGETGAGRPAHVYIAESRPAREGVGVAERLARADIEVTLVTDAAVAHVLSGALAKEIDRVVVGADTLFADGSVMNKTGTRGAAIAATNESVPVEVVTASDKVATTDAVEGEERPPEEVYDGDADIVVANPTFDVTPAAFVDSVVTERGVRDTGDVSAVADDLRALAAWQR